ncbi:MAG TPA: ComEA family DNA-binding protein [Armatimonadota bacterium]|nr:ComEA family DNA-binding protein [Armatimonadota bacterium]
MRSVLQNGYTKVAILVALGAACFIATAILLPGRPKAASQRAAGYPPASHFFPGSALVRRSALAGGKKSRARTTPRAAAETPSPGSSAANVSAPPAALQASDSMVVVHVAGRVRAPDVYQLAPTKRVIDAVRMAGGPDPDADLDAVNLAAHLQDGEQIYVPSRQAVATGAALKGPIPIGRAPLAGPLAVSAATHGRGSRGGPHASRSNKLTDPSQGTIDINTAAAPDLARLPGVGPSTAARILAFRKANGKFTGPADIMNVKGIGPAKFAKMKPFITTGR